MDQVSIELHNKKFKIRLNTIEIQDGIKRLSNLITATFGNQNPIFLSVLNGSFVFTADLLRQIDFLCEIQFIKLSSYEGTQTTGKINELIGLTKEIKNRHVIILEDIIDSGLTVQFIQDKLLALEPASLSICTLLFKPDALKVPIKPNFVGFEVGNEFLVGYGLDYDELGRNLPHIYQAIE